MKSAETTRLFNRSEAAGGYIYYGREIRRIGDDRYLPWGDE